MRLTVQGWQILVLSVMGVVVLTDLCHIPVVVLTTSSSEDDILHSYKLHANAYVTKPVDLDQFMSAVRQIDEFFVQVVRLPQF
jgi:DNA-binding NarL/FixJ family response regulator